VGGHGKGSLPTAFSLTWLAKHLAEEEAPNGDNHLRAGKIPPTKSDQSDADGRSLGPQTNDTVRILDFRSMIQTILAALLVVATVGSAAEAPIRRDGGTLVGWLFATLPVVRTHLIPIGTGTVRPGFYEDELKHGNNPAKNFKAGIAKAIESHRSRSLVSTGPLPLGT
jgi:hypothetical protein